MSYQNELEKRETAAADAARETANRAAFSTICDHYPLNNSEANFQILVAWCGDITVAKFQAFVAAGDNHADGVVYSLDWSGTRSRLLAEIANELDPKGVRLTEADLNALFQRRAKGEVIRIDQMVIGKSHNIDALLSKLALETKAKLRATLAELRYRREVKGKSAADLQADLAAHRKAANTGNPWAPYPVMPAEISATEIKAASQFKIAHWNKLYSVNQVNARLNGRA